MILERLRRLLDGGTLLCLEGPNGAGKSSLALHLASEGYPTVPPEVRPRGGPWTGAEGEALGRASEAWLERLPRSLGGRVMDRGWVSVEVYRALYGRPAPSPGYRDRWLSGRLPGATVLFLLPADADLDARLAARGDPASPEDLRAERAAFRLAAALYGGPKLEVRGDWWDGRPG